ncbi:SOS cell division inhibitor [Marinobacter orientalis]|uniref:SOS cell division inhibitor n=1 Tax=Marinobacter orientalis TaxID=1928859 RepID=A0A7Y0WTB5_9GAMM|nr:SOS cell division inhibitor [Marinobacter orientalis]NMT64734.1 SOS cell division inhibitor [Marinobacter orientalis]TGX48232.1 SOS cell division inhibitor [Marinobacter orientalis]
MSVPEQLKAVDTLVEQLKTALAEKNWEELSRLNEKVKPTIEPVMVALEAGELSPEPVRKRLATLQTFCDRANISANEAKAEARQALKGVNQNRSAAKAYQNVSSNRRK